MLPFFTISLAQNKIKTENSLLFNPEYSLNKGNYSKFKPNKEDLLDIKKAVIKLNNLRQYNFSQGIVVRNNKIVSIEGKDGTKKMLEKKFLRANIDQLWTYSSCHLEIWANFFVAILLGNLLCKILLNQ